ncbi:MAG: acetyl/propionyl/methylcrotonyl-CoA carboxylase subunit alpha [Chthoniobacterales bacterium]
MFDKILIANRGEISCRIAATASRLGIRTVAVYSECDKAAKHVMACDEAIYIGGAAPVESYLRSESIIRAAQEAGAQAIHPGYGFLAEREDFATDCAQAGLTFIGPPPSAIRIMGNKSAAKVLMGKAGIPIIPGYHGENQEPGYLQTQAEAVGYPVLLKASGGGGGKGIRVVAKPEDFEAALASCRRESRSSFGQDSVLIEKYLTHPRHIEIQVFADKHGNYVHLFERDCSVQRRYQKVIEEAPAPGLTEEQRLSMGEAALSAARAVGYVGAGTVEFIADQDSSFYFMEMNTRLQVEHAVTEMITRQDLVAWQLSIAAGLPLPLLQAQLSFRGHAIETRIYAENPDNHFLPSTGILRVLKMPKAIEFEVGNSPDPPTVRVDSGVREGDVITPYYDPMIAKLIVWGEDRTQALARLQQALGSIIALGLQTNLAFLRRLVSSPDFTNANFDTGLIDRDQSLWLTQPTPIRFESVVLAIAALLKREEMNATAEGSDPYSPWAGTSGWRLNGEHARLLRWMAGNQTIDAVLSYTRTGRSVTAAGVSSPLSILAHQDDEFVLLAGTRKIAGQVYIQGYTYDVFENGEHVVLHWVDPLARLSQVDTGEGRLTAPMPGRIVAVFVKDGQTVLKGTRLMVMEAMKMEHAIEAPTDGVVDEVLFSVGDQVAEGAQLLRFSPSSV